RGGGRRGGQRSGGGCRRCRSRRRPAEGSVGRGLHLGLGPGLALARGLGLGFALAGRGLARLLCGVLAVFLARVPSGPGVVGHVPPRPLELEAGVGDETAYLSPAVGAPVEGGIGNALRLLEIPALLASVLVDRHGRGLIPPPRPVKPADAGRVVAPPRLDRGRGSGRACRVPERLRRAPRRTVPPREPSRSPPAPRGLRRQLSGAPRPGGRAPLRAARRHQDGTPLVARARAAGSRRLREPPRAQPTDDPGTVAAMRNASS